MPVLAGCVPLLLVVALVLGTSAAAAAPPAPSPADSLARKIDALRTPPTTPRGKGPRVFELSEGELATYLNVNLRGKLPEGVSDVVVRFDRDRLIGAAIVDFELVRQKLPPMGAFNPLSYLTGRLPSEFSLKLTSEGGFGSCVLESLSIGPVVVPSNLVGEIVARSTRNADNPEGIDIAAPFRLPYAIKRVRLQPGRAVVEY